MIMGDEEKRKAFIIQGRGGLIMEKWKNLVSVAVFLVIALVEVPVSAEERACKSCFDCTLKLNGDVERVKLSRDINVPEGEDVCVEFGADNITFDCNGHTITGPLNEAVGIKAEGREGIRIENCTLKDFKGSGWVRWGAIRLDDTKDSLIEHNKIISPIDGIWLAYSNGNLIGNNTVLDAGWMGIAVLSESNRNLISANWTLRSAHYGIASCDKIGLTDEKQGNWIVDNTIIFGDTGGGCL
jgi:parallel beta-helix repeat protein